MNTTRIIDTKEFKTCTRYEISHGENLYKVSVKNGKLVKSVGLSNLLEFVTEGEILDLVKDEKPCGQDEKPCGQDESQCVEDEIINSDWIKKVGLHKCEFRRSNAMAEDLPSNFDTLEILCDYSASLIGRLFVDAPWEMIPHLKRHIGKAREFSRKWAKDFVSDVANVSELAARLKAEAFGDMTDGTSFQKFQARDAAMDREYKAQHEGLVNAMNKYYFEVE